MRYIHHPEIKPVTPPPTHLFNILYSGNIIRRNLTSTNAYAMKAMLKKTGNYDSGKLEVKAV